MSQFLKKDKGHRILLFAVFLLTAGFGLLSFIAPPGADPDTCWGFLVMHNMQVTHQFNILPSPYAKNIALTYHEFLSWWSPGQYMLPYFFIRLLNLDTGHAVALTVTFCSLTGLAGFYLLFKQLGFTKWLAAISVAFIAGQQFFIVPFTYYLGGECLLFAFSGWFIYGCFKLKKLSWQALVLLFLAGLIGFFSKSSFLWMYAAGAACLWINVSFIGGDTEVISPITYLKKNAVAWLYKGVMIALPFIGALTVIYIFYLSKGDNPTSDGGAFRFLPETFTFPLASPILSAFSVDELSNGFIYQPGESLISYQFAVILLVVFSLCCLAYVVFLSRFSPDKKYALAFIVFYAVGVIFFTYMYLKQATISYEDRHFRIIGLLFIPGFIQLCFKTPVSKLLFFASWAVFLYLSFNYTKISFEGNKNSPKGVSGISQQLYDQPTLNQIIKIDREHANNAVFVVMSPDIAMEITHNRVVTLEGDMTEQQFFSLKYAGKAGPLYLLMPESYKANGRLTSIMKSFADYHHFTLTQLSPQYVLASATN